MKFALYMVWIFFCKDCKYSDKICYIYGDKEFFQMDCFLLAHPVYYSPQFSHCLPFPEPSPLCWCYSKYRRQNFIPDMSIMTSTQSIKQVCRPAYRRD